jgi:hypothetical protein
MGVFLFHVNSIIFFSNQSAAILPARPHSRVSFKTSFGTIRNKTFVSAFCFYTETESFGVSIEPKQAEEQRKQFDREHILDFSEN